MTRHRLVRSQPAALLSEALRRSAGSRRSDSFTSHPEAGKLALEAWTAHTPAALGRGAESAGSAPPRKPRPYRSGPDLARRLANPTLPPP